MSPFSRRMRRKARNGVWDPDFLRYYGTGSRLPDVTPHCKREIMRAVARGCYVTATYATTGHAPNSWHGVRVSYKSSSGAMRLGGRAVDVGGGPVAKARYYLDCKYREYKGGVQFIELFGPGNWYVKWGSFFGGQFPGHEDHVHVVPNAIY